MRNHSSITCIASLILVASAALPARAQLPTLEREPWLGFFAAYTSNRFQVGITSQGEFQFKGLNRSSVAVGNRPFEIVPLIVETLPNGKPSYHDLDPESLETTDSSTERLEKTSFRAKTKSGIPFEVSFEESRGLILLGGRITGPASTKNPLAFSFVVRMPDLYANDLKMIEGAENEREKKKLQKIFDKDTSGDRASWKWTDGTRMKRTLAEPLEISSKEINGPGISEFEIESLAYQERKFQLNAAPNSSMKMVGKTQTAAPLHRGFVILWSQDPAKDPNSEARLAVNVR